MIQTKNHMERLKIDQSATANVSESSNLYFVQLFVTQCDRADEKNCFNI